MPLWWNWTYRSVWGRPKECTWWHVGDLGCATWISNNEPDGWTRTCWGELDMHSNNGRRTCTNGFHFDGHAVTPCKFLERLCNWYWLGSSLRALYFWDPWCETKTTQTKTYIETLETIFGWRTTTEWLSNLFAGLCTQQTGDNLCRFGTFVFMAGFHYGACSANLDKFKPSLRLTSLSATESRHTNS